MVPRPSVTTIIPKANREKRQADEPTNMGAPRDPTNQPLGSSNQGDKNRTLFKDPTNDAGKPGNYSQLQHTHRHNPGCKGGANDTDCLKSATSDARKEELFDVSALLLIAFAVILGEAMLTLTGITADESYYRYLDEIDATENHRHQIYTAVISAVVLGIAAVAATQFSCLPLSTWSSSEIYLLVFSALVTVSLPFTAFFPEPGQTVRRRSSSCRNVKEVLLSGEGIFVIATLMFLGALAGIEQTFFLWHLEEGNQGAALGAVVMARAVSRVAALLLIKAGGIPGRIQGWLVFAILCTSARCACYVQSGWELAAVAQLLSPPSTVLLWGARERWARRASARIDTERHLLAVLDVCHGGIGWAAGAILGGTAAGWLGVRSTLGFCAIIGTLGGGVVFGASRCITPRPASYDRLLWDPSTPDSEGESEGEECKVMSAAGDFVGAS